MDDRTLDTLGLAEAPRDHPLIYPGRWPTESGLLYRNRLLRLSPVKGRRLAKWSVDAPPEGFPGDPGQPGPMPLNHALMIANEPLVGERYPVLSVGSNASPAQLRHKMRGAGVSATIPMIMAKVRGIGIGASPYVNPLGYVATAPYADPGATRHLFLTWLDAAQLEVIDASEGISLPGGEYQRAALPGRGPFEAELPSGELLSELYVYVNMRGVLREPSGAPRPHEGEVDLLTRILAESDGLRALFGDTPEAFCAAARGNESLCDEGTRLFAREDRITKSDLEEYASDALRLHVYDDIHPLNPLPPESFMTGRTPDAFDHRGAGAIRISAKLADDLGHPQQALVQKATPPARQERLGALARVVVAGDIPENDMTSVQVDHSLRVGLGLEPGEPVTLRPTHLAHRQHRRWHQFFFGRPNYLTCRVQDADRPSAEQEVCLADDLTLALLGVQSGDDVIIEGFPDEQDVVPVLQLKAIRTSEEILDRRKQLHGGNMTSRFPSSLDALGCHPDLPWVFIDRGIWDALGIHGQWLGTVRIRASRSFQLKKELREMVLLLGIAFLGVVELIDGVTWQVVSVGLLVLLVGCVVTIRMRARMSLRARHFARRGRGGISRR
ncbi:hypothetical protein [Streptomyces kanamyceticus]|uniref:Uncharacterized protein n=1 Tax=Streptomyces kanamyceticus TaxID=1967 RepID=A0A5J6GLT2_STRKN|nr:hypothetical protein [Streptomyces kanamyceticus]QEU96043.1 hypothetical protein CP970_38515 [Streptomyces kanamyceticus]